jgi:hypothetical protein
MKFRSRVLRVGLTVVVLLLMVPRLSLAANVPELRITQLNITGDEYVTIQNSGAGPLDLSNYWLGYSGSDTATAVPAQQLSAQILQPGETMMLNNGAAQTCGAVAIDDLSFSLSNTAGTLALWRLDSPAGGSASFVFLGSVAWGKSATAANYLHIADESNVSKYNAKSAVPTWLLNGQSWQVGDMQSCQFTPVVVQNNLPTGQAAIDVNWPVSADTPPFTILPAALISNGSSGASASIPASDVGLSAVQLSEVLPNPASPGTDTDDEFIELYNPNSKAFDLSGFKLQIVSATSPTVHSYTIPAGTAIAAKGFRAFMSADTNLSLNNTAGQVWFVDPLDHTVSTTGAYSDVTEGASLINTNGKWQWTMAPTPGAANKLQAVAGKNSSTKKSASVNGRSMTGLTNGSSSAVKGAGTSTSFNQAAQTVPLHPGTLAAVICLALLYLGYEYRRDVANKLQQLREYRAARS